MFARVVQSLCAFALVAWTARGRLRTGRRFPSADAQDTRLCAQRFEKCEQGPLPQCRGAFGASRPNTGVSFALVTGAKYAGQEGGRPWAQRETWLTQAGRNSWAYFSDAADDRLPAYEIPGTAGGWKPSQKKWLGLLERLAAGEAPFDDSSYFPAGAPWLFVGDDDTFVWTDALADRLGSVKVDPDAEALYLGLPDSQMAKMVGQDLGEAESYCMGGAGFLLSRKAAQTLKGQDVKGQCEDFFSQNSDVAVARCLVKTAGIKGCTKFPGMNQRPCPCANGTATSGSSRAAQDDDDDSGGEGDYPDCAPVTFHWMKPDAMRRLWRDEC